MPKITGVLHSPPMARAAHEGRKTNTRRLLKLPKGCSWYEDLGGEKAGWWQNEANQAGWWHLDEMAPPYGRKGDLIWVREQHYAYGAWTVGCGETKSGDDRWVFLYDDSKPTLYEPPDGWLRDFPRAHGKRGYYKRSSLFMSRSECRTWLEITDVKVERLQDISEEDAKAEGVERLGGFMGLSLWRDYLDTPTGGQLGEPSGMTNPIQSYRSLWEALYGKYAPSSWDANPWVHSYHYKRVEAPKDAPCPT